MAIEYDPKKLLKEAASEAKIKKMLTKGLGLKRSALSFTDGFKFIKKRAVSSVALKAVKDYQKRFSEDSSGQSLVKKDPRLLINRVQNAVLFQVTQEIKSKYQGESYEWLPSDAEEPDPEHQLLYGKVFRMGEGDSEGNMPGERYGCRCGMRILVNETELSLG